MVEICWCNELAVKVNHKYKVYQVYVGGLIPNQDMVGVDTTTRVTEDMLENRIKKLEQKGYTKA